MNVLSFSNKHSLRLLQETAAPVFYQYEFVSQFVMSQRAFMPQTELCQHLHFVLVPFQNVVKASLESLKLSILAGGCKQRDYYYVIFWRSTDFRG